MVCDIFVYIYHDITCPIPFFFYLVHDLFNFTSAHLSMFYLSLQFSLHSTIPSAISRLCYQLFPFINLFLLSTRQMHLHIDKTTNIQSSSFSISCYLSLPPFPSLFIPYSLLPTAFILTLSCSYLLSLCLLPFLPFTYCIPLYILSIYSFIHFLYTRQMCRTFKSRET